MCISITISGNDADEVKADLGVLNELFSCGKGAAPAAAPSVPARPTAVPAARSPGRPKSNSVQVPPPTTTKSEPVAAETVSIADLTAKLEEVYGAAANEDEGTDIVSAIVAEFGVETIGEIATNQFGVCYELAVKKLAELATKAPASAKKSVFGKK